MNQWVNNSPPRTHEDCEKRNKIPPFDTVPVPLPDGTKQRGGEPTKLPTDPRSREEKVNGVGGSAQNGQTKARVFGSDPFTEPMGNEGLDYAHSRSCLREGKSPGRIEKMTFAAKKAKILPSMILHHCHYFYIQPHSIGEKLKN